MATNLLAKCVLVFGIGLGLTSAKSHTFTSSPGSRLGKVIIDTDGGADDAGGILLALAAQRALDNDGFEIVAITCTYGNTNITNVGNNVLKILTIANNSDIPVYLGAHKPLLQNSTLDYHFGNDGLGDFEFDKEIIAKIDRSKHASLALIDLARNNSGNISVLAIGPLTNIALAMSLDPGFIKNVMRFWIMGSSVRGFGNVAPNVEFNFHQDPESNFIVLNGTRGRPAALLPWETSLFPGISMEWRKKVLGAVDSTTMKYLNKMERKSLKGPLWSSADITLVALALWPELTTRSFVTNVTPVYDGIARGSVLVDYANTTGKPANAEILEAFDVESYKKLLLEFYSKY